MKRDNKKIDKSRFNFRKSQITIEKIVEPSVETEIIRLKRELNKIHDTYQKKVYIILNKILILRKRQIKNYGVSELAREKGIKLSASSIKYLFGFKYFSEETNRLINRGKLKPSTALFIIKQDMRYREPEKQNKIMKMYVDGKLNTSQISRVRSDVLMNNVVTDKEIEYADDYLVRMIIRGEEIRRVLVNNRDLFSDGNNLQLLIRQFEKVIELINDIIKTGKRVKALVPYQQVKKRKRTATEELLDKEIEE